MGKVKLKDIASASGLSVSTVSRILSGDNSRKNSDETIERVLKAARELGYSEKGSSFLSLSPSISLACIFVSDHESILSPFFAGILQGIRDEVEAEAKHRRIDFSLILADSDEGKASIANGKLDMAVILGRTSRSLLDFIAQHVPLTVYAGLNPVFVMDEVICDVRQGMAEAVRLLRLRGGKNIGYIGPMNANKELFNEHRYAGFRDGIDSLPFHIDNTAVDSYLTAAEGYEKTKYLLEDNVDSIVAANDIVATGVLIYLSDNNIRVPEDVQVTGFDNIESSAFLDPPLTTFCVQKEELGRFAVKTLIDRKDNPRDFNIRITIPYQLIERDSVRRL